MRTLSRIVKAIESRISARLPPTWCWIVIAVAISSRSSERTRRTMFSRATSNARPRLTSRTTRPNSIVTGGEDSRTTISIACRNDEPARRALATRVMVSGSCLLNAFRRPARRRPSHIRGRKKPMTAPIASASPVPSGAKTTLSTRKMNGTARTAPAQMAMNSPGLSLRSALAMSRARLAPKSRSSTTRFRRPRATLRPIMSPKLADGCVGVGPIVSIFPAA